MRKPLALLLVFACFGIAAPGCRHCDDTYSDADDFLREPTNLECTTDDDCVEETHTCAKLDSAFCEQVTLSRTAAASPEWQDIRADLRACAEGPCPVCDAGRSPTCSGGHCL